MAVKGDLSKINDLKKRLRKLPITVAEEGALEISPRLTSLTHDSYTSGRTVHGDPRPPGVDGRPLTLRDTGETQQRLGFYAVGTQMQARLPTKYARYLIGKYDILPNGPIPQEWRAEMRTLLADLTARALKGGRL